MQSDDKKWLRRVIAVLRWSKVVAKITAIGATVSGAVMSVVGGSAVTGFAVSAAGATSYAAVKNIPIPVSGYERTRHIPPVDTISTSRSLPVEALNRRQQARESKVRPSSRTFNHTLRRK